jgi:hypothetical protein
LNKVHIYILALTLAVIGLGIFFYKIFVFDFPLLPETKARVWQVETKLTFIAKGEPVRVRLFLPWNSESYKVFNEAFISRGYGLNTPVNGVNRRAVWNLREARGKQVIYYRAAIRRLESKPALTEPPLVEKPDFTGADLIAAEWLVDFIHKKSTDNCSMAARLIQRLNQQPVTNDNLTLLLGKHPGEAGKVELAVKILALAGAPARQVNGIRLSEHSDRAELVHWLEVYDGKQWSSHDPVTGLPRLAENYLAWWRGPGPLAQVTGGNKLEVAIDTSSNPEAALQTAIAQIGSAKPLLLKFSLFNLPLHTQSVYRVLLLVPVGVFVLVLLRNVIGLAMFGTFMPVLIALAFRETQLLWGIVLFSLLVGLGLAIRFYLEHLKLLLVPRLAVVLIAVIILMALMSIFTHQLGIERGLSVALFPMVIITMTIERMSIVWEERGAATALQQGMGSLAAAALAYMVMHDSYIKHLFFVFPELLLVLCAATILLGRYSGFRLLELWRFQGMGKEAA